MSRSANVYVVFGCDGQYESHDWPVAAFPDFRAAEAYAKLARARSQQLAEKFRELCDAYFSDSSEEPFPERAKFLKRNQYDRHADDFAETYYVQQIPLHRAALIN